MLRSRKEKQQGMEVVILEQMVPENHLLRKIDRSIDFSFINKLCAPLYSENVGRPAVDPEILFRMLFVGYLYGIRSERRLECECQRKSEPSANQYLSHLCERILEPPTPKVTANT